MKAFFVPSLGEGKKIFPGASFNPWQYGIYRGNHKGTPVFVTGVSKSPAVFAASIVIREFNITEAVLTGVCGAYRESGLSVGEIVSIRKDWFADEGLYEKGSLRRLDEMGFPVIENGYIEFDITEDLSVADSNTVSLLDGEGEISEILHKSTKAQVENMEGAAFGYVCKMLSVKCFQIRAVSNFCGLRTQQEWDFKKAVSNLKNYFDIVTL